MKKSLVIVLLLLLICTFTLSMCSDDFVTDVLFFGISPDYTPETDSNHVHTFGEWEIIKEATCKKEGKEERYCTCGETETRSFSATTYTATEIYNQSVKYVGEIITYDKNGSASALGTGFVIASDGKILTNYHVIDGAYSADIKINNVTYDITSVLAYDADIDLAVLKIDSSKMPYANICKLTPNVGEPVYAIGSSRGLTNTYSQGIITYAKRVMDGVSYVQHDASITHGNSGGPLINSYGEVIGVNTGGISDSQNLNFAVSVGELDNLVYGTSLTLAELYEETTDAFASLVELIIENGTQDDDRVEVYIENSFEETVKFEYYPEDGNVWLTRLIIASDNSSFYLSISLEKDVSEYLYYAAYGSSEGQITGELSGHIESDTFTANTLIGYNNYDGPSYLEDSIREVASEFAVYLVDTLDDVAKEYLDLTAADFGFVSFP